MRFHLLKDRRLDIDVLNMIVFLVTTMNVKAFSVCKFARLCLFRLLEVNKRICWLQRMETLIHSHQLFRCLLGHNDELILCRWNHLGCSYLKTLISVVWILGMIVRRIPLIFKGLLTRHGLMDFIVSIVDRSHYWWLRSLEVGAVSAWLFIEFQPLKLSHFWELSFACCHYFNCWPKHLA